jgi:hypothetical protein
METKLKLFEMERAFSVKLKWSQEQAFALWLREA